ncbi:MAG: hypothetical protein KF760_33725 [Candidatus Eremiobacteraeota bacterium]|nr:hypothetical protein [Candidatus Eremiobacteraeota bacterium]MCW5869862.1 hypothetical protein [Candidatus Eremiobacteraeota bacterium]
MKKLCVTLLAGLWLTQLASAETRLPDTHQLTRPAGHWTITRERPVDQNKNGRIDRNEWKPQESQRPWNRPRYLEGQTQRWNVKWEPNSPPSTARALKL